MLDFKKILGCLGLTIGGFLCLFALLFTVFSALFIEMLPLPLRAKGWEWMYGELGATEGVPGAGEFLGEYEGPDYCPSGRPVNGPVTAYFLDPRYEAYFGFPHYGVDFGVPEGTPVKATISGRVVWAQRRGGYGLLVAIRNGDFLVLYGHFSRIDVKEGQVVERGQVLGLSGNTGLSTGPHVHYEIRYRGKRINPLGAMPCS